MRTDTTPTHTHIRVDHVHLFPYYWDTFFIFILALLATVGLWLSIDLRAVHVKISLEISKLSTASNITHKIYRVDECRVPFAVCVCVVCFEPIRILCVVRRILYGT